MNWQDLPQTIERWHKSALAPAEELWACLRGLPTISGVGAYWNPEIEKAALYAEEPTPADREIVTLAVKEAIGPDLREEWLTRDELAAGPWVKAAYSPALRRAGEVLNFFPGQYAAGIPNHPSPAAAMLTSGLLGAGLGYGAGWLLGRFLPGGWGPNLGRTGAIAGGLLGAAPGALWAASNLSSGRSLLDPRPLNEPAGRPPLPGHGSWTHGTNALPPEEERASALADLVSQAMGRMELPGEMAARGTPRPRLKRGAVLELFERPEAIKEADTFSSGFYGGGDPADVQIDHLGRTLYDLGASPRLAGATMGAMYAAQQLPDPRAQPGLATGHQLGQLAWRAAGDYAKGYLAGAALNTLVGTPFSAPAFGGGLAALGAIGTVVSKLYGG